MNSIDIACTESYHITKLVVINTTDDGWNKHNTQTYFPAIIYGALCFPVVFWICLRA